MSGVDWECPVCGKSNYDSVIRAESDTCKCIECNAECEVYFEITATDVIAALEGGKDDA